MKVRRWRRKDKHHLIQEMGVLDDQNLLLEAALLQEENIDLFTGDGSVDFEGKSVLKSKTGNWKACYFILGNEICERLAFYGVNTNLVSYLTQKLHEGNVSAARMVSTWSGTCYITPLIGAFLADAYWGKYWSIAVFSIIHFIGMSTLTLSASVPMFRPGDCEGSVCPSATPSQYAILYTGLYLVSLGMGGIKPCISSFGADQFDDTDSYERIQKASFFNWFYFTISIGCLIASTLIVWIQENVGWDIGFGIPSSFMVISIIFFFCGTRLYRFQRPGGSPLTRICQVLVASISKFRLKVPEDSSLLYETSDTHSTIEGSRKLEHTEEIKFLDKAAVLSATELQTGDFSNNWRLCTVTQVEELKVLIRMAPIWATSIIFSAVYDQMSTTFIEQGMVMNRMIGPLLIPAASLSTFSIFSILFWIPFYDKILVPLARKYTGKAKGFTELQRMGIGQVISIFCMLVAGLIEIRRLHFASKLGSSNETAASSLSIFWQIPQYFLMGAAEIFFYIGKMEFFYDQSPDAMRSLCTAFSLLTSSLGSYSNSLVLTIVTAVTTAGGKPGWIPDNLNNGQLYNYFFLWAGLSLANLLVYVICAMKYKQKKCS
ncbi:protein NRT1/ PTR FAMILY 8.3-like [Amaranthus tricolor]|uniref:protein NRT1/ PTR FAMILY 8.3-like n=1 Tax=Amaranthus tricolor TaxID=29722 RepID=UPI00258EB439|nr:protein NRT1/ PTR FAMILY 8.3-like [Amaranthus tricolor]